MTELKVCLVIYSYNREEMIESEINSIYSKRVILQFTYPILKSFCSLEILNKEFKG